jgi:hypothetical protein
MRKKKLDRRTLRARVAKLRDLRARSIQSQQEVAQLDNVDPNPFDLLTPTRNNFANIPDAIAYYQARLDVCTNAAALLARASVLAEDVRAASQRAALSWGVYSIEELEGKSIPSDLMPTELRAWATKLEPMVDHFVEASKAYHERGELLKKTIAALRRGMLEIVK